MYFFTFLIPNKFLSARSLLRLARELKRKNQLSFSISTLLDQFILCIIECMWVCVYFPVRLICKTTCTRCNCERDDSRRRRHHHHHRSARTSISNGTKNVLCCQTATVLKELNRDNSGVIKFPVYFLRSHLQVYLLSIVCQMLMSTYTHTHTHRRLHLA